MFFYGDIVRIRLNKNSINAVDRLFSEPFNAWHLQATEAGYQWLSETPWNESLMFPALGKDHADQLINGNISSILSLAAIESLPRENPADTRISDHIPPPKGCAYNIIDGMVTGVFDECCTRLSLTDFSLIHKSIRGYLLARGTGCSLGLVSHIYGRYMEPFLPPDSHLNYLCDTFLPHSLLAVSAARGNLVGTVCALASYSGTRHLINLFLPSSRQRNK